MLLNQNCFFILGCFWTLARPGRGSFVRKALMTHIQLLYRPCRSSLVISWAPVPTHKAPWCTPPTQGSWLGHYLLFCLIGSLPGTCSRFIILGKEKCLPWFEKEPRLSLINRKPCTNYHMGDIVQPLFFSVKTVPRGEARGQSSVQVALPLDSNEGIIESPQQLTARIFWVEVPRS